MYKEFHTRGKLPRGSNAFFLALILKKDCSTKLEDYRPISLVECSYKILEKMQVGRLSKVLKSVISASQSTFMQESNILDGVVVVNELIGCTKKKGEACMLLKVGFEKAYDSVSLEFLHYMLERMGFNGRWRYWIKECLVSASVSMLVNDSPTKEFYVSKGLQQGDPMAPFLFLIVAEGLTRLIKKMST